MALNVSFSFAFQFIPPVSCAQDYRTSLQSTNFIERLRLMIAGAAAAAAAQA